jgi:hypothetical protein
MKTLVFALTTFVGAGIDCFEDLLPFIFATEGSDTQITAMDYVKFATSYDLYIGGSTYDNGIADGTNPSSD